MGLRSFVGFAYAPTFRPSKASGALIGVNRRMVGVDAGLSDTCGMSAGELVTLMNRWLCEQRDQPA